MTAAVIATIVSACASACALFLSSYVIYSTRQQKRIDNLVSIQLFLHRDDLSEARRRVRESKVKIALETDEVRRVCSSFDFAGVLLKHNAINKDIFLDYWASMLIPLDEVLAPIVNAPTGKGVSVRDYYKYCWWLMSEAKRHKS